MNRKFSWGRWSPGSSLEGSISCSTSPVRCSFGWSPTAGSFVFRVPDFGTLLRTSPLVAREIMRTLATTMRNMKGYTQEREKLIQLGTMAAGLAHELNNPATAARRAAADLRQSVEKVQHHACELNETLSTEQW